MAKDLLETLQNVGYEGSLLDDNKLSLALELGPKSTDYTNLVAWLAMQIKTFVDIDEMIHPTITPNGASCFLLESSNFLKRIGCMNQNLTTGNVNERLNTKENNILLLENLITELMTFKLLQIQNLPNETPEKIVLPSTTAETLNLIISTLDLPRPPPDITIEVLFSKLENKLKEVISKVPKNRLCQPLFYGKLSSDQWDKLCKYNEELCTEYTIRRQMLLTRVNVTLQSFSWSGKGCTSEHLNFTNLTHIPEKPNVEITDLFAKRLDFTITDSFNNTNPLPHDSSRTKRVLIGDVPDRGGRPYELEPPPPEMPPWEKDRMARAPSSRGHSRGGNTGESAGYGRGGGVRGSGRGGRGSYVSTGGGTGYASTIDEYGGPRRDYSRGGGNSNLNNSNYSGGAGYGNNRGRGNYYNTGGADNKTSGVYQDYNAVGNYGQDYNAAGNYGQNYNAAGNYGQDYKHNSGRGGRVQDRWNQGGHNSTRSDYQQDGYNRGRARGKRQY